MKVASYTTYPTIETLVFDILDVVKHKIDICVVVDNDMAKPIIKAFMNIDNINIQLLDYDDVDYYGEYYVIVNWVDDKASLWVEKAHNDSSGKFFYNENNYFFVSTENVDDEIYNYLEGAGTMFTIEK